MIEDDADEARAPVKAWCDPEFLHVVIRDGRRIVTPLWWYPRLLAATPSERATMELMFSGIHWPMIDEDLSIRGMLLGCKAPGAVEPAEAA